MGAGFCSLHILRKSLYQGSLYQGLSVSYQQKQTHQWFDIRNILLNQLEEGMTKLDLPSNMHR